MSGASKLPNPSTNAYRKDLADVGLAGQVIASHYAEPLTRHLITSATLVTGPADDSPPVALLQAGDGMRVLDISRGWAWGYAPDGRVGYLRAEALGT